MKIFGREPAVWIGAIEAVIAVVVAFNVGLDQQAATILITFIGIVGGGLTAWTTTNSHLSIVVTVFKALLVMAVGFGLTVTDAQIGLLAAVLVTIGALFNRTQNSPEVTAVSTTTRY